MSTTTKEKKMPTATKSKPAEAPARGLQFTADRRALADALGVLEKVVKVRTPVPALTCVLLDAGRAGKRSYLDVRAHDGEVGLTFRLNTVDVIEPGRLAIPADRLRAIVAAESDATLMLSGEDDRAIIAGSRSRYTLFGYPPEEFVPDEPFPDDGNKEVRWAFRCPCRVLAGALAAAAPAMSTEHSRYAIGGVLLARGGGKAHAVATDGRRLHETTFPVSSIDGMPEGAGTAILPAKAVSLLGRVLPAEAAGAGEEETPMCEVAEVGSRVLVRTDGGTVLATALVEGSFPPYENVIPKEHSTRVTLDRKATIDALRRARLLTSEESRGVRMAFGPAEGNSPPAVQMSARTPEIGESAVECLTAGHEGPAITIGLNPDFLRDALGATDSETVTLDMTAPNKPCLLTDGEFRAVVVPLHLD